MSDEISRIISDGELAFEILDGRPPSPTSHSECRDCHCVWTGKAFGDVCPKCRSNKINYSTYTTFIVSQDEMPNISDDELGAHLLGLSARRAVSRTDQELG